MAVSLVIHVAAVNYSLIELLSISLMHAYWRVRACEHIIIEYPSTQNKCQMACRQLHELMKPILINTYFSIIYTIYLYNINSIRLHGAMDFFGHISTDIDL